MTSKRSHEGYILIDHRESPGVPDEMSLSTGAIPVGKNNMLEAPTYTCSHCQVVVILNPLRNRERAYCRKCDHYICDKCGQVAAATGGACRPFAQVLDEMQEQLEKNSGSLIIQP